MLESSGFEIVEQGTQPASVVLSYAGSGIPVLDHLLDDLHELVGDRAVDDAVVVADRHVGAQPDRDGVVQNDRPLLDRADADDGDLRLADDRHAEQRAEHAGVRDRERSALHVLRLELLLARARGESAMALLMSSRLSESAFFTTGTMSPQSSATATPMLMSFL